MKKGTLVVCINDKNLQNVRVKPIKEGKIYTIRDVCLAEDDGSTGLLLEEVHNEIHFLYGTELTYRIERFAPLNMCPDSISIEEILENDLQLT